MTDSAPHPNVFVILIVGLAETATVTDDRVVSADWAASWETVQGDHPGSILSFSSDIAIKRITAGVKAATDRPCQVSI